jgi:hypothetical protein
MIQIKSSKAKLQKQLSRQGAKAQSFNFSS